MVEAVPSGGSSPVAGAPGAQPPGAPAVHASSNLSRTLLIDVGIAVAIFLLLAVPILTYGLRRRRRARAARLAEVRAAAQPVPPRKPPLTRHATIDTVEPDRYEYIPAPPNQGFPAASPRSAAFPPAGSPPVPSPAPSSPAASSPPLGARMGTNGTRARAHPPWAPWGSENGTPRGPAGGTSARAIPGSAFPAPGDQGLPTNPPGPPPGPSAPGGSSTPGGLAALIGLAGQAGPGDQGDQARGDQAGRRGAGGLPRRTTGQAGAGGGAGPAAEGPAHVRQDGGGLPGWNIPGMGTGAGPEAATAEGPSIGAQRPGASRAPRVTGLPPWEPAPEPAAKYHGAGHPCRRPVARGRFL